MAQYDQRIATRISRDADDRLRAAAGLCRKSLSAFLTDLILGHIPEIPPTLVSQIRALSPQEATA
jgi:uncharacterized protein (DUF1778 family)